MNIQDSMASAHSRRRSYNRARGRDAHDINEIMSSSELPALKQIRSSHREDEESYGRFDRETTYRELSFD